MGASSNLIKRVFDRDQYLFDNLTDDQKLAFSRLLKEMAQVDDIALMEEFKDAPDVPFTYMHNSSNLSYSDAIQLIRTAGRDKCEQISEELEEMAKADGRYSNEERDLFHKIQKDLI